MAQITSLTEDYLLFSKDPVRGGKMEWSQEEKEGKKRKRERPLERKTAYDMVSDSGQESRRPTVFTETSAARRST